VRTNIMLDDELVKKAFQYADVKTKRALIDLVLREFVEIRQRRDVRELRGKVKLRLDYDYKKLRAGDE